MRGPGYAMYVQAAIRAAVDIPVVGAGRITDPQQADQALADGQCDLVAVVRGQIADPDFAARARAGEAAEIRTCLSCNQECAGRVGRNRWLGCTANPRAGHNPFHCRRLPSRRPAGPARSRGMARSAGAGRSTGMARSAGAGRARGCPSAGAGRSTGLPRSAGRSAGAARSAGRSAGIARSAGLGRSGGLGRAAGCTWLAAARAACRRR